MKSVKELKRNRRHARIRARVRGTAQRPRLAVSRSLRGVFVQLIDDDTGATLASISDKKALESKDAGGRSGKVARAYVLGRELARLATEKNITAVVFDRGGYAYHGRVQALADGARDGGLQF